MYGHPKLRRFACVLGAAVGFAASLHVATAAAEVGPGDTAPDFTFPDIHDVEHTLSDFRGQVVLLDFIGYACNPCITSAPAVEQIWQDFKGSGAFQAIAVDVWNGQIFDVVGYIKATGTTFPVLRNAGLLQDPSRYGIGVDNYLVIDAAGIVRLVVDGPLDTNKETVIRSAIEAHMPVGVRADTWGAIKDLYR